MVSFKGNAINFKAKVIYKEVYNEERSLYYPRHDLTELNATCPTIKACVHILTLVQLPITLPKTYEFFPKALKQRQLLPRQRQSTMDFGRWSVPALVRFPWGDSFSGICRPLPSTRHRDKNTNQSGCAMSENACIWFGFCSIAMIKEYRMLERSATHGKIQESVWLQSLDVCL